MPEFDTPGSVSLQVRLPSGRVRITTADQPRTSVELIAKGRRGSDALEDILIRADEQPGGHVITIEQKDKFRWGPIQISWGGDFEVHITCPPGADLDLAGGSTNLEVEGMLGEVTAKSASGDISLQTVTKKLQLKTASGDVSVGTIEAEGAVVTVSGDLEIQRVLAPLNARTVSGDVQIGALEAGDLQTQTVSGDVRIGVARGARVWIDAVSVSGDLDSELGLADQAPEADSGEQEPGRAVVPLHVKTVSGDVNIVRAAAALSRS
ncbi:MAG: DUF4097 family beta strand repeat protein [Actinobacteria bacterium]|nr:DUF4097 family beta strand repeat protein [Actinomycetota bacterium]